MSEVSLFALRAFVDQMESEGLPLDEVLRGTTLSHAQVRGSARGRCTWHEFATIVENATDLLGGLDEIERFGSELSSDPPGLLVSVAKRFASMHTIYYLGAIWYGPASFRGTRATITDLSDGVIESLRLGPELRVSVPVYHVFKGVVAGAPRMIGWPDADVEMSYQDHEVAYRVRLNPPKEAKPFDQEEIARERRDAKAYIAEFESLSLTGAPVAADEWPELKGAPLSQRVRWLIEGGSSGPDVAARRAARQLGMSERSLARGLSKEGTTFSELKDGVRCRLAIERLVRGDRVEDVAGALGFADPSSFHRAFRRWTGRSPGSYHPDS